MGHEPMGSKRKFWCLLGSSQRCLFKYARPNTGEDWAEKVAAEVAVVLGIPHARVELATHAGGAGSLSFSFLEEGDSLVHGNELLQELEPSYPREANYRASRHTVRAMLGALRRPYVVTPRAANDAELVTTAAWVLGYLLLDALIGNTDRHHENWAVVELAHQVERRVELAPSYDHASSLGRDLSDEERVVRLACRDRRRTVRSYAERARSALYLRPGDARPLHPIDAFREGLRYVSDGAKRAWISRLRGLEDATLKGIVQRVPSSCMTEPAQRFAAELLICNKGLILERTAEGAL